MEKELSNNESLALITEMINRAKRETAGDGGFQMRLWGWVIAICNFGHFTLEKIGYEYPYYVWFLVAPAAIVSFWKGFQIAKKARVKSHISEVINQVWITVFVGIVIMLAFMPVIGYYQNPIILILAGIGMWTTGALIRVNFVRGGGLLLLVAAVIGFMLPISAQYLVSGIAMVLGYLLPGYYLNNNCRERV
ncbi:hypothetical protein [Algoriphagus sp. A40]|uniref:hypothetical protein n=1 Tax=Algoriphagus sp. A40 TaxID=1945863 RepID=UPI000986A4BA|nr:hypothetical protein [Algoriphagus sp. A40]OOG70459.1 hypothetical protein B0E43_17780 [Algoriphagus sp. A40]